MFGHQDDTAVTATDTPQDAVSTEPAHDGVLESSEDNAPAPSAPVATDYIATDQNGQPDTTTPLPPVATPGSDDLLNIKQQALQQLSPLVGHLDQTPEEKFHTTMMMIQASDNQALIKDAYTAAQAITDEKTRAQALLDIINEINYFTQHGSES
jgi:hypothetical protein